MVKRNKDVLCAGNAACKHRTDPVKSHVEEVSKCDQINALGDSMTFAWWYTLLPDHNR